MCYYNGVRWIHDYQDACVEKIVRFIRGEIAASSASQYSRLNSQLGGGGGGSLAGSNASGSDYQPSSFKDSKAKWKSIDSTDGTLEETSDEGEKEEEGEEKDVVDGAEPAKEKEDDKKAKVYDASRPNVNGESPIPGGEKDVGVPNGDASKEASVSGEEEGEENQKKTVNGQKSAGVNDEEGPLVIKENGWERGDANDATPSTNGAQLAEPEEDDDDEEEEEEEEMEEVEERSAPVAIYAKAPLPATTTASGATLNGRNHESSASEDEIEAQRAPDANDGAATKSARKDAVESSA